MSVPIRSVITGVSTFYPERVLTNQDLEKMVDTSDEWIQTRTGIKERRIVKPGQAASDLGAAAVSLLLKKKGLKADDIDLIIIGGFVVNVEFARHSYLSNKLYKLKMGRVCRVEDQRVYYRFGLD